jgi:hypothetical protein
MKRLILSLSFVSIVLALASCGSSSSREVIFRAKLLSYSTIAREFYPSASTYLVSVDSGYRSTDTVIWNNERYILLERSK